MYTVAYTIAQFDADESKYFQSLISLFNNTKDIYAVGRRESTPPTHLIVFSLNPKYSLDDAHREFKHILRDQATVLLIKQGNPLIEELNVNRGNVVYVSDMNDLSEIHSKLIGFEWYSEKEMEYKNRHSLV